MFFQHNKNTCHHSSSKKLMTNKRTYIYEKLNGTTFLLIKRQIKNLVLKNNLVIRG